MTQLSLIVATADNNVIGKDNQMPWHLPADLAYFKKVTLGKPVIMGRKTFESIGRPLPGRRNIVISRDECYQAEGVETVTSVEQALSLVNSLVDDSADSHTEAEIMVIGGGAIYQHCLSKATRLYVTHIDAQIDGDTRFPDFQKDITWKKISSEQRKSDETNAYNLDFCVYQRQL